MKALIILKMLIKELKIIMPDIEEDNHIDKEYEEDGYLFGRTGCDLKK